MYGTFASVIGVLTWLSLHASIALGGADLNHVRAERIDSRQAVAPVQAQAQSTA